MIAGMFTYANYRQKVRLDAIEAPGRPILDVGRLPEVKYATTKQMEQVNVKSGTSKVRSNLMLMVP